MPAAAGCAQVGDAEAGWPGVCQGVGLERKRGWLDLTAAAAALQPSQPVRTSPQPLPMGGQPPVMLPVIPRTPTSPATAASAQTRARRWKPARLLSSPTLPLVRHLALLCRSCIVFPCTAIACIHERAREWQVGGLHFMPVKTHRKVDSAEPRLLEGAAVSLGAGIPCNRNYGDISSSATLESVLLYVRRSADGDGARSPWHGRPAGRLVQRRHGYPQACTDSGTLCLVRPHRHIL